MLHEEINRLPRALRTAIILCDLEGHSPRSAAEQLGWPLAKLRRRLALARGCLRTLLVRHGVTPAATRGITAGLHAGLPVVSRRLIEATVRVATARRDPPPRDCVGDPTRPAMAGRSPRMPNP